MRLYDSSCHPVKVENAFQPGCEPVETFGAGLLGAGFGSLALDSASATEPLYVARQADIAVFSFLTVPGVETTPPLEVGAGSQDLTGTVDPSGIELNAGTGGCRFEWGALVSPTNTPNPATRLPLRSAAAALRLKSRRNRRARAW